MPFPSISLSGNAGLDDRFGDHRGTIWMTGIKREAAIGVRPILLQSKVPNSDSQVRAWRSSARIANWMQRTCDREYVEPYSHPVV
jgi:hypothetical protein